TDGGMFAPEQSARTIGKPVVRAYRIAQCGLLTYRYCSGGHIMRHSLALAVAAVTGMGISQVHGATANFIGGSVEGNRGLGTTSWTDPANWQDGYIPQEGDKVVMLSRRSGEND